MVTANISVAVAVPMDTVVCAPVASAVTSAGGVTTGTVVSTTVMFCVAVPVLPAVSVAVHVTTVVPTGNISRGIIAN